MLSNIAVNRAQSGPQQANVANKAPETEGFDFMSYLLGLEELTSPTEDATQATAENLLDSEMNRQDRKTTDSSKDGSILALFPGMTVPGAKLEVPETTEGSSTRPTSSGQVLSTGETLNLHQKLENGEDASSVVSGSKETGIEIGELTPVDENKVTDSDFAQGLKAFQQMTAHTENKKERHADSGTSIDAFDLNPIQTALNLPPKEVAHTGPKGTEMDSTQSFDVPELFSQVDSLAQKGGGTMKVTLNPPELGQVEVEVSTKGRQVHVELKSESEMAKTVLESRLGELRNSIQSQDLVVSKLEVNLSSDMGRDSNAWLNSQFQQQGQGERQAFSEGRHFRQFDQRSSRSEMLTGRIATSVAATGRDGTTRIDVRI